MNAPVAQHAGQAASAAAFRLVPRDGRLAAEGPLTFATARRACALGARVFAAAGAALEIDCSGIATSDSAGLAVLLEWLGSARRAGRKLRYTRLPAGLAALARISEVEEFLTRGV
jgi:phospholipid transport system transporter-binding protein